jgi:hypothetical protein
VAETWTTHAPATGLGWAAGALPPGPTAPQPGVPTVPHRLRLPRRAVLPAPLVWIGVHGGAGETTLTSLVPGTRGAGRAWPSPEPRQAPPRVALVARTSMRGLRSAQAAAVEWAGGAAPDVELLGLVLIADAPGRLPATLPDFAALVAGGVPRTWHLPWVDRWRLGHAPTPQDAPRPVRRFLADVAALTSGAPAAGAAATAERGTS